MFTGIVEELGTVRAVKPFEGGARLTISARAVLDDAEIGSSIAVNGVCLTVVELGDDGCAADAVIETMARTNLGDLEPGAVVNLERPLRLSDRLGGHLVQGHVDSTGEVTARDALADGSTMVRIRVGEDVLPYIVHKGSVAVDGISLTVAARHDDGFSIAVIPHTLEVTTMGTRAVGARVNIEVDMLAKYVEQLLCPHAAVSETQRSELAGAGERSPKAAAPGKPAPSERDHEERNS
ncbi:MAG TPA: riboflavin synthase [Acidimicrobiia bacterium]|nr:riboflavin synthase [Acidimicrobiia bacterium]